ncbi:Pentatricopeptide repeat-containing protein [Thalictrum thalictroides]|uniref:Pentatricopeptide repeat-containing protein n=1 Tax=Thalictrum thalictroides TaxID=46969 RepID=A0A7J6UTB7_THATH|nr:Pentatricopeptide repeat-containing protein [Thalictrum thalictroides]
MPERDVVSWNSMMGAYMTHGEKLLAIELFDSMPDRNVVSWNSMITWLSKEGDMEKAQTVFERMTTRNELSWNTMISGYVRKGDVRNAKLVFDYMPNKTVVSWTAMITGYAKIGELTSARSLFYLMPVKNVVTWNAMIAGYVQNNMFNETLRLFHQMLIDGECRPNEATLVSVLSGCARLGALEQGTWINSYIGKHNYYLGNLLGNALIDMFAKCGDIEDALEVFHHMRERCIITWTTMVSGLAINGKCREALCLFDTMCKEKIELDDVVFISVLSACTHGGLVQEGQRVFNQMVMHFGIEPRIEHYGCVVDLLTRAGMLDEAFRFIMNMPMEPNAIIWATLLGSCKMHGKLELAEAVTQKICDLDPSNPGHRMMISNLNASVGRWDDVLSVRDAMRKESIEKVPACSMVQIEDAVHEFLVQDNSL